jgi:hypothetical protein
LLLLLAHHVVAWLLHALVAAIVHLLLRVNWLLRVALRLVELGLTAELLLVVEHHLGVHGGLESRGLVRVIRVHGLGSRGIPGVGRLLRLRLAH